MSLFRSSRSTTRPRSTPVLAVVAVVMAFVVLAASCSSSSRTSDATATSQAPGTTESLAGPLVLVTHDSFAVSDAVLNDFESRTGIQVKILHEGDAVEMVNKAILTKDNPEGDVLFGIDNNTLNRAYDASLFESYASAGLGQIDSQYQLDDQHRVTPIDHADVCLNYDVGWFTQHGIPAPTSMDDLTKPAYKGLMVVENPATSTPGLAFMLASIAHFGDDGWTNYWQQLRANDVQVVDGWEQAYNTAFSGSAGKGDKPIVVSYATSPAAEVLNADPAPATAPTAVVPGSCFRQIELAGVLAGTKRVAAAQAFIDFMVGRSFQEDMPLQMYVEPVNGQASEPDVFARYVVHPSDLLSLDPAVIGSNHDAWIDQWTTTVQR
jgi:thiamine transport system substrate-binding protein